MVSQRFGGTRPGSLSEAHYEFARMMRRLNVSPSEARESLRLSHDLTPVVLFDQYFWRTKIFEVQVAVTSAAPFDAFTVPENQVWEIIRLFYKKEGGSFTVDDMRIHDDRLGVSIPIDDTSFSSSMGVVVNVPVPISIEQKDRIQINITSFSQASVVTVKALVRVATAF